jgi:hypothetical protein
MDGIISSPSPPRVRQLPLDTEAFLTPKKRKKLLKIPNMCAKNRYSALESIKSRLKTENVPGMPDLCTLSPVLYDEKYGYIPENEAAQADPEKMIV